MTSPRCIVVTGAASGIGKATAKRFAAGGDMVVIADRDETRGREVVADITSCGGQCDFRPGDVAADDSVDTLAAEPD